jgi:DNA-binding XRE family transcriptional regulator
VTQICRFTQNLVDVYESCRALRIKRVLTQHRLAAQVGTSQQRIHHIEAGY